MTLEQAIEVLISRYNSGVIRSRTNDDEWRLATDTVIAALRSHDPDTGPEGSIRKREKMRSVKKETMDELARITRKYWTTGDTDILDAKHRKARELSEQAFGSDAKWLQFCDIVDGAIYLNRNVPNDTIYKIFGLLCIEVNEC